MPPKPATINEEFEYRIKVIINNAHPSQNWNNLANGDELESLLDRFKKDLATSLLDDINSWMGFDELLEQLQKDQN